MRRPIVHAPESLDEVLALLDEYGDEAKVLAGGTALMIMLQAGLVQPEHLVSLWRVRGLEGIEPGDGALTLGARVTLRTLERDPDTRRAAPLLAQVLPLVANARVRNAATIGGNVSEADYASDPPCVLTALEATAVLAARRGERRVPLGEFFRDYYETAVGSDELLRAVEVPVLPEDASYVYLKVQSRSVEDRPVLGVCVVARTDDDDRCTELRVVLGAATATPVRVVEAERMALGRRLEGDLAAEIAHAYASACAPLSDVRGSGDYRRRLIGVHVRRALAAVAQGTREAVRA